MSDDELGGHLTDVEKPELPYGKHFVASIRRHVPPVPFGTLYAHDENCRKKFDYTELRGMTQSRLCRQHPPAETAPHSDQTISTLKAIKKIACGDERGAQVLRCQLDGDDNRDYVAKIYDPLYYKYYPETPNDVTWEAESHYSQEAATYEELAKREIAGLYTPTYHGSWTFEIPFGGRESTQVRPVRMVLLGWIQGVTMESMIKTGRVRSITPEQRLKILAKAMEIDCKILFHGVLHRDLAPRNILLADSDIEHELPHRYRPLIFKGWIKTRWPPQMEEFSEAPAGLRRYIDFDEPVEYASPMR